MTQVDSTPYSRDLGDELRQLREKHTSYTGTEMGHVLGWHQTKVSNVENGRTRASEVDIVQYLTTCKRSRAFVEDFLKRYQDAFATYLVQLPDNLRTMVIAETSAVKITNYAHAVIPGMLQTEDYARAVFQSRGLVQSHRIESFVQFRMQRQALLNRLNPPDCTYFVHEQALRLLAREEHVVEEQILRLLFKRHIVRIVPESAGLNGAIDGNYTFWEYERDQPVAYTESRIGQLFATNPQAVARHKAVFAHLETIAMDEGQSREKLMEYISRPREEPDEPDLAEEQLQRRL